MKKYLDSFKAGFQKFSQLVADLVNLILLAAVYFIGIGITAIIAKIAGRHFLDIKNKNTNSYWKECTPISENIDDYYRMF